MPDVEAPPAVAAEKAAEPTGPKEDTAAKKEEQKRRRCCRPKCVCLGLTAFILFIVAFSGITYGVLSPQNPRFSIDDVSFNSFNVSQLDFRFLNSNLVVTLSSTNPIGKVGVYYGKVGVHLTLEDILVTDTVFLDSTLQEPGESTVWTVALTADKGDTGPALAGEVKNGETAFGVTPDQLPGWLNGLMVGSVRADGWVQWKVGSVMTPKFGFHVICPVTLMLNDRSSGEQELKSQLVDQRCSVHVRV